MLGWVAERYPSLVRAIVENGHELASHGYDHTRVIHQDPNEFRNDVDKTKKILEDIGGVEVKGYRAASYSITKNNLWAHDMNNSGQIVGRGTINGEDHAFLMTPIPEPATIALLSLGGLVILRKRKRQ